MKKLFLGSFLLLSLVTSCSQLVEEKSEKSVTLEIPKALPNTKEFTDALYLIVKKAGFSSVDGVEFFDLGSSYSESIIEGRNPTVYVEATLVDKKDKNKLMNYRFDFEKGEVSEGEEIVLTSGFGSSQEIVEGYDNFKSNLFKTSDIAPFSKMDEMQKSALDNSDYKVDEQFTSSYKSGYNSLGNFETYIYVQNKKVRTMSKPIYFDKNGAVKK
jgi:hypothetical protein